MFRILVVDDEPVLLAQNKFYLEQSENLHVVATSSPLQALDMLSTASYDAVVVDYEMPELDGIALLKMVRGRGLKIPYIIFSGRGCEEVVSEALNSGVDFYLLKGDNPSAQFAELRNVVLQAVGRREAETEVQRAGDVYRCIFEHTGSATIIIESDTTIALANREFADLTGYSREEIEGKMPWTVFIAAEDVERIRTYHRQRRMDPNSVPRTYRAQMIDRHGNRKDLQLTTGMIPGTDRSVASMIDITDRKRVEEELTAAFEEVKAGQESLEAQFRELEDYRAKLRDIIDFLPDPTFVLDRTGKVIVWNRAIEEVTRLAKTRVIGSGVETICEAVPGLQSPLAAETVLSPDGADFGAREVLITLPTTGQEACFWARASPLYDGQGKISGAIESLRDITELKWMEAQIRYQIDYEQMVSSLSTRFIALNPADLGDALREALQVLGPFLEADRGYIVRISPDLAHTGSPQTKSSTSSDPSAAPIWAENIHEWCAEGVEPQIEMLQNLPIDAFSWGMDQVKAQRSFYVSDVANLPQEASTERDYLLMRKVRSLVLVPITIADEILGVIGFETTLRHRTWSDADLSLVTLVGNLLADLLSRIRTEEKVRKSEERFRSLVERSHDCYIRIITPSLEIEYISPSCENLTGYTPEEILSDPDFIDRLVHSDDREIFLSLFLEQNITAGQSYALQVRRKDGRYIWIEVCPIPVYGDDGRPVAIDYAIHNIDASKQTEAALIQASKKLALMSSIVRHDILNQLTVVLGYTALLRDYPLDEAVVNILAKQQVAAEIIKSQIEFTREYQDLGLQVPQWLPIKPPIMEALETIRPPGVQIFTDVDGISIYADPLLSSVFYNLLENAVRHGKTVTEIRVTAVPDDGGTRIIWEDNGVGVPIKRKERIFEWGFGTNTGLGLFLVREILSITGITITETGEPGKGARFEIAVPEGCTRYG